MNGRQAVVIFAARVACITFPCTTNAMRTRLINTASPATPLILHTRSLLTSLFSFFLIFLNNIQQTFRILNSQLSHNSQLSSKCMTVSTITLGVAAIRRKLYSDPMRALLTSLITSNSSISIVSPRRGSYGPTRISVAYCRCTSNTSFNRFSA